MTPDELNAIRTRYCSIPQRKMQDIVTCSGAAYRLIQDVPRLLETIKELQNQLKKTEDATYSV